MNAVLQEAFRAHGVEAIAEGDWVVFPRHDLRASAAVVRESPNPAGVSVQFDVRLALGPERTLVESFGGVGANREEAAKEARQNFLLNSFHVLFAAFFAPGDPQVTEVEWTVGGVKKRVTLGNIGVRGKLPAQGAAAATWLELLAEQIQGRKLPDGIHWVRLYYAQMGSRSLTCEVLLDNEPWEEVRVPMAAFDWPRGEAFYSVRLFLVLQGGTDVGRALGVFLRRREREDNVLIEDLIARGLPGREAEKVVALAPLAFGRVLLKGLSIRFADTLLVHHPGTKDAVEVRLDQEPIFVNAMRLAEEAYQYGTMGREGFGAVAFLSPEVDAVNQALNAGSKPEDLVCSPTQVWWSADDAGPGAM